MKSGVTKKRLVYLDVLRILACVMVLYHHSYANEFYVNCPGWHQYIYLLLAMTVRIDVPVFFMISGSLLYSRETDYRQVMKKFFRFLVCLLVFEIIVAVGYFIRSGEQYSFPELIAVLFRGALARTLPGSGAYWYLYGYLGMLLMLPILQRGVRDIGRTEYRVLFILHAVFWTILPLIDFAGSLISESYEPLVVYDAFEVPLAVEKAFFFTITGYYIDRKLDTASWSKAKTVFFVLSGILAIGFMAALTAVQGHRTGFTNDYVQTFDYWIAIVLFILVKRLMNRAGGAEGNGQKAKKILTGLSVLTFGIYLFDPVWHMLFDPVFYRVFDGKSPLLLSVCWCLFSFALGGAAAFVLKKIPGVRRFL